jgi:iron complex transport system permease protein
MGRYPHLNEGSSARSEAVRRALESVGAAALAERALVTLSGGELQKAFLASVVAQETPLLLLDEPTVFLDPGRAAEIQRALVALGETGRGVILATHDLAFAAAFATRVLALKDGRVVLEGPPAEVLSGPALAELYDLPIERGDSPIDVIRGGNAAAAIERSRSIGEGSDRLPPRRRETARPSRDTDEATPPTRQAGGLRRAGFAGRSAAPVVAFACAFVLLAAPFVGPGLSSRAGLPPSSAEFILWQLRVPRVLLAALAGASLAMAGAAFQALFRNPLATPYTLGVASGAALGAVAVILTGLGVGHAGLGATGLGALAGALAITAAAYGIGRNRYGLPTATLLLGGVTLGFFFSSLILLLQYFADFAEAFRILRWLLGEVRIVGYAAFVVLVPLVGVGAFLVLARRAELNLLLTGEELAHARGADVERVKRQVFLGTSFLVAAIVSVCGPIGFVGLVVPHAVRSILGPDLRRLLPACVPVGAAFLVVCDTVARLVIVPAELPVGVVTALIGGPVFLIILLRRGPTAT